MDSPVRKQQKRNDYLRHKMFRKIKRRRKAEQQQAIDAPAKELRRRLRRRTFKCGKDAYSDGKDDIIDGGSLPEVVVIPDSVDLYTQYPLHGFTGTSFIGHSSLVAPAKNYIQRGANVSQGIDPIFITKQMEDSDYNLISNNCSDATRNALEIISGKKINPFLFTTPGDVKDFAESELGGVTRYIKNGKYRTTIPLSKNDRKVLSSLSRKKQKFAGGKDSGIHIKPENRGKFTRLKKRTGKSASWFKAHGTPAQKKMAVFALNSRKWSHKK